IDTNGELKWSYQAGGWIESSPLIGSDGTIYFGSNDNHLYAIGN
ncbi:MAG: PQQ-binding-like beta-propeller repeat protein, partial [Candidatus Scalindua sp.]|nr:PQQ-binding-like beta-propeller repeat protein [Candidatus Scalindua sp.]